MPETNAPEVKEGLCVNCGEHERYHMPAGRACMCNRDMYYAPTLDHPNAIARRSPAESVPNDAALMVADGLEARAEDGSFTAADARQAASIIRQLARPAVSGEVERAHAALDEAIRRVARRGHGYRHDNEAIILGSLYDRIVAAANAAILAGKEQ